MKKKLFTILLTLSALTGLANLTVNAQSSYAMKWDECPKNSPAYEDGGKSTTKWADINTVADCYVEKDTGNDLMDRVNGIINVIVGMVGVIAVIMMVIGGIQLATSQGDTGKATKGKNTLIYGVVGLVVALLAFAIVNFVLKSVF